MCRRRLAVLCIFWKTRVGPLFAVWVRECLGGGWLDLLAASIEGAGIFLGAGFRPGVWGFNLRV